MTSKSRDDSDELEIANMRFRTRAAPLFALAALLGVLMAPLAVSAQSSGASSGLSPDPQVLASGFESMDALRNDAVTNANGDKYSAWLVESSRFLGVPAGGFMPDKAGPDAQGKERIIELPVNVGILKGKDGKITLYDSGWMQQDYIYRWNRAAVPRPCATSWQPWGSTPTT